MPELTILQRAIRQARAQICPRCYQRPAGSEALGPDVARSCEPTCPLFAHLPRLTEAVLGHVAEMDSSPDQAVRNVICSQCQMSPTAGEFCSEFFARTCPLSRYSGDLIAILEDLRDQPGVATSSAT